MDGWMRERTDGAEAAGSTSGTGSSGAQAGPAAREDQGAAEAGKTGKGNQGEDPEFLQNEAPLLAAHMVLLSFRLKLTFPRGTTGAL